MDDSFFTKIEEKLAEYCELENGHLMWKGNLTHSGIPGYIHVHEKGEGNKKSVRHYAYLLNRKIRDILKGMIITPTCDLPTCLTHLLLMTKNGYDREKNDCFATISDEERAYRYETLYSKSEFDEKTGCKNWTGHLRNGYGVIGMFGKAFSASVASLSLKLKRSIGKKLVCRHLCGNAICINADHLEEGTTRENTLDKHTHGTMNNVKLTHDQAREIFALKGTMSVQAIAKQFNVEDWSVRHIHAGVIWNQVTGMPIKVKRKHPDEPTEFKYNDVMDRIKKKVKIIPDKNGVNHMIWQGALNPFGHGQIKINSTPQAAHRAAYYAFHKQPFPPENSNIKILHKCEMKSCVDPEHLEPGSSSDQGQKVKQSKINATIAKQIKDTKGQGTQTERAERFHVSRSIILGIDSGKTWKNV